MRMLTGIFDAAMNTGPHDREAGNIERTRVAQEMLAAQMHASLEINAAQLVVQQQQLAAQHRQIGLQTQQLRVQDRIRQVSEHNLAVSQQQLAQAIETVKKLDITNHRLAGIDKSLGDISGVLVEQNALIEKSLNRLANEVQELLVRAEDAYNNGWFEDAANDLDAVLKKDPYSPMAHYYRAKCYSHEGKMKEAKQEYDKCVYYAKHMAPIFENLALCDQAVTVAKNGRPDIARQLLAKALNCREQDRSVMARTSLLCDIAEGKLTATTTELVEKAFQDQNTDPEVLLEVLRKTLTESKLIEKKPFADAFKKWEDRSNQAVFNRTISHFYRELDDFAYLAPRIRRSFMEAANGQFLSLGAPIADLLDWTAAIGERLIQRIQQFTQKQSEIIKVYRVLGDWNRVLVSLGKSTSLLSNKSALVSGHFVGQLNIGLLELPVMYEDDRVIFEVKTLEGDILALTCYYAIFTRNGVDHFPVALHEFSYLRIETYPAGEGQKGVLVRDSRSGQILIQGITESLADQLGNTWYLVDLFQEAAELLSQSQELLKWTSKHSDELFSVFLLLDAVLNRLQGSKSQEFEVVEDDNEFEVVE